MRRWPPLFRTLGSASAGATAGEPLAQVRRGLRWTGVLFWTVLLVHSLLAQPSREGLTPGEVLPWGLAMLAFIAVFLTAISLPDQPRWQRLALFLAALESVLALVGNALLDANSVQGGLLVLVAAQVAVTLPIGWMLVWVTVQTVSLMAVFLTYWSAADAWAFGTGYFCFQLFAMTTAQTAVREVRARQQLAVVVDELRATRALLAEASRQAERLQISRELHDLMGHHLTALGMNLQVALHQLPVGPARGHVEQAGELAHTLLSDVRTAVRGMRETSAPRDARAEIEALARTASLPVHLSFSPGFSVPCPVQSQVLLRTVQEGLTNVVRHAGARQVWLDLSCGPARNGGRQLTLHARDDGHGTPRFKPGCGLSGMRERIESVGGTLEVRAQPGQPLELLARLPLSGPATGGAA